MSPTEVVSMLLIASHGLSAEPMSFAAWWQRASALGAVVFDYEGVMVTAKATDDRLVGQFNYRHYAGWTWRQRQC